MSKRSSSMLHNPHDDVDDSDDNKKPFKGPDVGFQAVHFGRVVVVCIMLSLLLHTLWGLGLHRSLSFGAPPAPAATHSGDVASCTGYQLNNLQQSQTGLTARLSLSGPACNAFGTDVTDLTIQVTYETATRLHVNIFDTANKQYTIPQDVIQRPASSAGTLKSSAQSELVFNYDAKPFAFWITRRSDPHGVPLFDTRISSLPKTPIPPFVEGDDSTAMDGFPLVFEDQYLQIASALPLDTNIYGLGEVVASAGFRRGIAPGNPTLQTMWARDIADPVDENVYGSHPIYMEHRFDASTSTSQTHGVFLMSPSGADIILQTPQGASKSLIEYRLIGGTLDFYFLAGPTPKSVIEQYGALVGLPTWQPIWGFGFHLCRWGYTNLADVKDQVAGMRAANIPLEVMWTDIDLYHAVRDFTTDPVSFPAEDVRAFIRELASNNQHYIPIVDAAIAKQVNSTDDYDVYLRGAEQNVFITNPDGTEYVGQVWPGYTVFPDWFQNNTQSWWTESLRNWSELGVEYSGIWLDMNEASSFCDGSCGTGADLSNTSVPFILPGLPGALVTDYPECYDSNTFGPSGNMTMDGRSTCTLSFAGLSQLQRRGLGAGKQPGVDLNDPPYAIHNGNGRLSIHALATNATHAGGIAELDVHNLWGLMEEKATHLALLDIQPGKRPFMISRSTFPSAGKWTGHWLGDNFSLWEYLRYSIQGILQFQIFQIPFVGADTCGFNGNTDEELCNRWMQLAAFTPFYRNHNVRGAISQEPYRWDSVAEASKTAIAIRYSLLPYWYSLFANASSSGTPPIRALFFEFPNEPDLFSVDSQFLVGDAVLVTPVLEPNATSVQGRFPDHPTTIWRDWYTHQAVSIPNGGGTVTLSAPLGHIPVHIRSGSALLLHSQPGYTIEETLQSSYNLLVSLDGSSGASGSVYLDDGVSNPPGPNRVVSFVASASTHASGNANANAKGGQLVISGQGSFVVQQRIEQITILGVGSAPKGVSVGGRSLVQGANNSDGWSYDASLERLVIGVAPGAVGSTATSTGSGLGIDLNGGQTVVSWS